MAWFARSIANTLLSNEEPDHDGEDARTSTSPSPGSPPRGVREDLSELTDALAHRFQGLASFLAPQDSGRDGIPRAPNPAEIAGRFRAGLARLPGRQAVADLAKIASSLLPPEEDDEGAPAGFTEEAVAFARDAAMRPELWLDFPLLPDDDEEDSDEFDMTDAQQDHALAVESVAPELADLRIELCPSHMSEGCFWKIYFVLLHPQLSKEDAAHLSTPQILEAREKLSENLQYQTKPESNEDTVAVPCSNKDATILNPVEAVGVLKDQYDAMRITSFSNVDYGTMQSINLEDTVDDTIAVPLDNGSSRSSTVPVQIVPVLKDPTELSQSRIEDTRDFSTNEQPVTTVDSSPPKEYERKQPSIDFSEQSREVIQKAKNDDSAEDDRLKLLSIDFNEQSRVVIQKENNDDSGKEHQLNQPSIALTEQSRVVIQKENNDDSDNDGDEWLEEDTDGPVSTHTPIEGDEDISFSDLEEEDGAA